MKLLEREGPLAVLTGALEAARQGHGSVVLVTGEPGIGKTAVIEAFLAGLERRTRAFFGACDDLLIPRPLGPIRDLTGVSPSLTEALAKGAPPHHIHALLLDELVLPPAPTVLVIEDVHWADEATIDAIVVIGRRILERPAVLVLTYRPGEIPTDHPLHSALGSIRSSASMFVQLAPLSRAAVSSLAGSDSEQIFKLTGGNPFYVIEMIGTPPSELPPSVATSVLGRVAQLDEPARKLCEVVAMVPSRTPSKVLDLLRPDWESAAEAPERHQLLHVDPMWVRFRHELARVAVEASVSSSRRRKLHGEIVEALLRLEADSSLIVHHAEAAGDLETVSRHALPAARQAKTVESNREAFAHFRRAADFAERLPIEEQALLYEELAEISYIIDRLKDAFEAVKKAIALNQEAGARSGEGRCRRLLSRFYWYAGEGEKAAQEARAAVAILEPEGRSPDLAHAYSALSQLAMLASNDEEAIRWAGRALALADELQNERIKAHALINLGVPRTNVNPDDTNALLEAFAIADRAGDRHEAVRALIALAWGYMTWVRPQEALLYARRGIAYADEHQVDTLLAYLNATSAWLQLRAGHWAEAEELAASELQKGVTVAQLLSQTVLTELAVRRGDDDAGERLAELAQQAESTGELQRIGPVLELEMEWALTRSSPWPIHRLQQTLDAIGPSARQTIGAGRLCGWAAVANVRIPFHPRLPKPYAAMVESHWNQAAKEFGKAGWEYDRALMLSLLDDESYQREALYIARHLGASPLTRFVEQKMRDMGWSVPRMRPTLTHAHPAGLTERQSEVLQLLAEGLTNAEIGERLYISSRTAEHHVEAILSKLGVSSRKEAVARFHQLLS